MLFYSFLHLTHLYFYIIIVFIVVQSNIHKIILFPLRKTHQMYIIVLKLNYYRYYKTDIIKIRKDVIFHG